MGRKRIQDWSMGRIVREVRGRLISPSIEVDSPSGVSTDTRALRGGELFFALRGDRFDGHDFVEQAVDNGACAVVVEDRSAQPRPDGVTIVVDDCYEALARLGHALFRQARQEGIHSVALTGSNGKTTTKEILAALWGQHGTVWATPGNLNNHIGVPLTLCAMPAECDHLIVELGANHRGEIEQLIELVPADQRIVTSIGRAHIEGFGSMAGVRKAKGEIFYHASRATSAIVPEDEAEALIPRDFSGAVLTFGTSSQADVRITSVTSSSQGEYLQMAVRLEVGGRRMALTLPLIGRHNASNLAAAMATFVHRADKLDGEAISDALDNIELPGGRLRIVEVGGLQVMDDAYNANPTSMRASFRAFEEWIGGASQVPALAVIGDMLELGKRADREHRELASWLSDRSCLTALAFVGEFGEIMARSALGGRVDEVFFANDHDEMAQWLGKWERARVFIKGSRANQLERVIEKLKSPT